MRKKTVYLCAVLLTLSCLLIPSVQSYAISALSIFRTKNVGEITISLADIEEMSKSLKPWYEENEEILACSGSGRSFTALDDPDDFQSFRIRLPKDKEDPELMGLESEAVEAIVDSGKINENLHTTGIPAFVDSSADGRVLAYTTPAVVVAKYQDVTLYQTRPVRAADHDEAMNDLWQDLLGIPYLTDSVRDQLLTIDWKDDIIYYPVVTGLAREVKIGDAPGYLYSASDFAALVGENNQIADGKTILIWSKNKILYALIGNISDQELAEIARSIR